MRSMIRKAGALLAAVAIAGTLTACGPGSANNAKEDTKPTDVSTDLGDKKYELTLWDGAGLKAVDEALIAGFEAKYPNITIKGQYDPDNVSGQNGPRVISASDAPDIARVTDMNTAVRGNHLISLEAYVKAYGWDVPDSQTELYRVDSNGKLGDGDLYALPNSYSVTGIYFNTKLAKQLGIDAAPKSVDEFVQDMQKAKDGGVLPMMTYAKDGGTSFVFQALMANNSSAKDVQNWILQKSGSFDTKAAQDAAATLQEWNKKGYLPKGVNAVDASTALSRFCSGEGLFFPSGNWNLDTIAKSLGEDVQFFAFPGATADDEPNVAANAGAFYGIPVNSKNHDAAAAFLNYTQSDEAQQIIVDNSGYLPKASTDGLKANSTLQQSMFDSYAGVLTSGHTSDFINNATAGMQASGLIPNFQLLLDNSITPQEFTKNVQAQYEKEAKQ
ncbi:ABC transporter substrate-binding protein [Bifidobacterium saguinibicoloris]|uniref:ABC transporter substrate-binding protein n=1 Tax=Bifidobacterium saguinibicoloris TaxID=2834433 RepID=UPI001C57AEA1|nr:extracellular solute-binding protein [Bifidobacterium saguinibicoloris]MBW3081405.1 extracellular solute-binding protein [Bifidobacterium saguinibicoloris]